MFRHKRTTLLVFALILALIVSIANAYHTYGTPTAIGIGKGTSPSVSTDGLSLYVDFSSPDGYGGYDIWVYTRETIYDDWSGPVNPGPTINSAYTDGNPNISADGLTLLFNSDWPGGPGKDSDVWQSTRTTTDEPWSEPVNLGPPTNGPTYDGHSSISSDGLSLFFCSDRPGGEGDRDIYISTRATTDDPWSEPENLGPSVNTLSGDSGPDVSSDGLMLFFDSKRPGGHGDDDVWVTTRATTDDSWSVPVNLGPVVNTTASDKTAGISADGSILYFYSNGFLRQVPIIPIIDFNDDGVADIHDLQIMNNSLGTDESLCDIGPIPWGDGVVDDHDLDVFIRYCGREIPPHDIVAVRDIPYVEKGHTNQVLDLFLPDPPSDKPLPLMIWIHGGAYQRGTHHNPSVAYLVNEGFAVASIQYRFSQHGIWPAQSYDGKAAIRFLRAHAAEYNLDPDHFGVGGYSAGGHLAAFLGTSGEVSDMEGDLGNTDMSSRVQAVVDWSGPTDFTILDQPQPNEQLFGGPVKERLELVATASPLTYIDAYDPPFLIMHGDRDQTIPLVHSVILAQALIDAGVEEVTMQTLAGAGHTGPELLSEQSLRIITEFLSRILKKAGSVLPDFDLIAYWKLDETEGTISSDSQGNHDASVVGAPIWQPEAGWFNGAIELDGVDDHLSTDFVIDPSKGPMSVFAWVKGGAPGQAIISQGMPNPMFGSTWLGIDSEDGRLITAHMFPIVPALESDVVITDDQWHRVGLVWDGTLRHLYVDGEEVVSDLERAGHMTSNLGLHIGADSHLTQGSFWSGLLDDVRIYDRVVEP